MDKGALPLPWVVGAVVVNGTTAMLPVQFMQDVEFPVRLPDGETPEQHAVRRAVVCSLADYLNHLGDNAWLQEVVDELTARGTATMSLPLVYYEAGVDQECVAVFTDPDTGHYFLYEAGVNTVVFTTRQKFEAWRARHLANAALLVATQLEEDENGWPGP